MYASESERWLQLGVALIDLGLAMKALERESAAHKELVADLARSEGLAPLRSVSKVVEEKRRTA